MFNDFKTKQKELLKTFKHKIEIKTVKDTIVNGRRIKGVETSFHPCYANILDLYGKELYSALEAKLENTAIFEIRYCQKLEDLRNKEDFIIVWQNKKYKIYYPDFLGYKRDYIHLKCNEVL